MRELSAEIRMVAPQQVDGRQCGPHYKLRKIQLGRGGGYDRLCQTARQKHHQLIATQRIHTKAAGRRFICAPPLTLFLPNTDANMPELFAGRASLLLFFGFGL